jgi:hypothetical protein
VLTKILAMQLKITNLLLLLIFSTGQLFAQVVSTLVEEVDKTFEAIHWHEDGRIYAIDFNNGRLYEVFTDGTVQTLLTGIANPAGGGFGSDGVFYYSALGAGTIHEYHQDGTNTTIATGLLQPTGILESSSPDTLYVGQYAGNSVVKVAKSSGQKIPFAAGNGINGPDAVIYDDMGNLLVANFNNNIISRVTLDGTVSTFTSIPYSGYSGYIARVGDYYYMPSFAGRRVYKIAMDGTVELFAGNGAQGNEDGLALEASFTAPNGVVGNPAGDTILISDGNRIRMITNIAGTSNAEATEKVEKLVISPNPASDSVEINWEHPNLKGAISVEVTDLNGKMVHAASVQATTSYHLSLQGISSGIHIVTLKGNNLTVSQKLIVQ